MSTTVLLTPDSDSIVHLSCKDAQLGRLIERIGFLQYTTEDDGYAFLVNTIIGQMLSKKAASTIQERLLERCVRAICADSIAALSIEDLRTIGVSANKAMSISSLYSSLQELNPESFPLLTDTEIIKRITSLRGLGAWSAKMYLIFVLDRQDILPFEDGAFLQAYRWLYSARSLKKQSIERRCRKWHPYASIGARYLYLALDTGLTKQAVPFWGRPKGRDCVQ